MANNKGKFINIGFPFKESNRGDFVKLNNDDKNAVKSDLMHLLLTRKGERLYLPDFGTDFLTYIFEPNDSSTHNEIKTSLNETIKKYLPNLVINEIVVEESEQSEYSVIVRIDYTVTDDIFQETDFVIIQL
jgi:phage baseplate assembly protein W